MAIDKNNSRLTPYGKPMSQNNPKPAPLGSRQPSVTVNPGAKQVIAHTPQSAGVGNAMGGGMGLGVVRQSLRGLGLEVRGSDPNCIPNTVENATNCTSGTTNFLNANVPRDQDLQFARFEGYVTFDPELGTHFIPVDNADPILGGNDLQGAVIVPAGMVFLLTHFEAIATIPNVGLPGSSVEVDPMALKGFVSFALVQINFQQVMTLQSIVTGLSGVDGTAFNGLIRLFEPAELGGLQTITVARRSFRAVYYVKRKPFPGFPEEVGVELSGYFINEALLNEALGNPQIGPAAGGAGV